MNERTLVVEGVSGGSPRLDVFLTRALPGLSRRVLRRVVASGEVRVNGRRAAKGVRLREGDRVSLPDLPSAIAPDATLALSVVYEDEALVALDKPGGMPGHAVDPRQRGTAAAYLVACYPEMAAVGDPLAPGLVHRLDTGTSGLLLAARTAAVHAEVRQALAARAVEKRYLALVAGDASALDGAVIDLPLAHDRRDRRRMVAASPGDHAWPAQTHVAVLTAAARQTLVEVTIVTGVTHQVRVHLAHRGHPVLHDLLYGGPPTSLPSGRHALHATALTLTHPTRGARLSLESPLPADLRALL